MRGVVRLLLGDVWNHALIRCATYDTNPFMRRWVEANWELRWRHRLDALLVRLLRDHGQQQ